MTSNKDILHMGLKGEAKTKIGFKLKEVFREQTPLTSVRAYLKAAHLNQKPALYEQSHASKQINKFKQLKTPPCLTQALTPHIGFNHKTKPIKNHSDFITKIILNYTSWWRNFCFSKSIFIC